MAAGSGFAALILVLASGGGKDRSIEVGQNRFVNPPGLIDGNNSPSVARNPIRPTNVVVSHRVDVPRFSAAIEWSENNGTTWTPTALPLPEGRDRPFGPDLAFGPDGTLYVTYVNLEGTGNRPQTLWLSSSNDGGRTLSPPVEVAGRLSFQAKVTVDPRGTVFVTWLAVHDVAPLAIVDGDNPVVVARSVDGGRTFSAPVRVSDPARQRVGAASPVIDGDGNLVLLYQDFKGDRLDFESLDGPVFDQPFTLVVTRSIDQGQTFDAGVEVDTGLLPLSRFLIFLPEFPSMAAGPGSELYVSWADGRHGDNDVFLRRSGDGGRTWGPLKRVNDNLQGDGTAQYVPRVDVAPDGRVDVLYLDRRQDPTNLLANAYLATSDDGGDSFQSFVVSSRAFDSQVGFSANPRLEPDFGSRLGLSSLDDEALAVWTDSRFGTQDTGRQDIASARIEFSGGGGGSDPVGLIFVLLFVGLAGLVVAVAIPTSRGRIVS
ncbi:MAG: sialidase family protein [Acidimicrobiales bacterium]